MARRKVIPLTRGGVNIVIACGFSWWTFLLGPIVYLYRGMWSKAVCVFAFDVSMLLLGISLSLFFIQASALFFFIFLVIRGDFARTSNEDYLNHMMVKGWVFDHNYLNRNI